MRARRRWIDATRPLSARTRTFPGDPPVRVELASDPRRGDPARVSHLHLGSHSGTHVDAPCHLPGVRGGVESLDPSCLVGPAMVVAATAGRLAPRHLPAAGRAAPERILLRGRPVVLPETARALVARGTLLVGTDGLSIDPLDDPALPAHRILLEAGVVVLESLDLSRAAPGRYDLIALPLLIPGADGSPARVLLRPRPARRPPRAGPQRRK